MKWSIRKIKEVCIINPSKSEVRKLSDETLVSFVPMSAVDENEQKIIILQERKLRDVKNGFTYFANGDILLAKITPCMENGKIAIAENLKNGIGFGSTEFHIIRTGKEVSAEWIFLLLSSPAFRKEAEKHMTGSAGQKRVPKNYILDVQIPVPPIGEQERIIKIIKILFTKIDEAEKLRSEISADSTNLLSSALYEIFSRSVNKKWGERTLKEICENTKTINPGDLFENQFTYIDISAVDRNLRKVVAARKILVSEAPSRARKLVKEGDTIFATTRPYLKNIAYIDSVLSGTIASTGFCVIRPNTAIADSSYVFYVTSSDRFINKVLPFQRGATYPAVSDQDILRQKIVIPPLEDQEKIVTCLNTISEKSQKIQELNSKTVDDLIALKKSILEKVFSGNFKLGDPSESIKTPFKIFPVQQAIAAVLRRDFERGEMVIAKVLYLAQEVYKVPLGIPFSPQNFGPYDQQVKKAITAGLAKSNRFFKKKMAAQFMVYALDDGSSKIFGYSNSKIARSMETALDSLMPIISKAKSAAIELLATTCKAIQDTKSVDAVVISQYIVAWKPGRFTDQQIEKMLKFVKSKNWNKELL